MGQISAAEQMVIIPLSTFKRLAEEAGDPGNVAQFKKNCGFILCILLGILPQQK
jgi:hypothetical protein